MSRLKSEPVALVATFVAALVSRFVTRSEYLFSWDSVNFALALDDWNLSLHQPHPPGYAGYIGLGRLISVIGTDHNTSLQIVSMLAVGLASWILWGLARHLGLDIVPAMFSAALLLSSPLVWLYSSVAEIYALDLLAVLTVMAVAAPRDGAAARVQVALAFACAALVKLPTALMLMPVLAVGSRGRWPRLLSGAAGVLAIVAAFIVLEPDYLAAFQSQFVTATEDTRAGGNGFDVAKAVNRNVRDVLRAAGMAGVGLLVLAPYAIRRAHRRRVLHGSIAVAWAAPMLAVFVFVHFGKPGYLVPLVPLLSLYVAAGVPTKGLTGVALLTAAVIVNVIQFTCVAPPDAAVTGGARRYADKTLMEKVATELSPVTFASLATLQQEDARVARVVARATRDCPQSRVIVIAEGATLDWRRAMFYLPQHTVIRFDAPSQEPLIARAHTIRVATHSETLESSCAALWLDDQPPAISRRAIRDDALPGVWVVESSFVIEFAGNQQLTISR